jgi:hypothetical protein
LKPERCGMLRFNPAGFEDWKDLDTDLLGLLRSSRVGYEIDNNVHYNRLTKEVEITFKTNKDFPRVLTNTIPYLLGVYGTIYPMLKILRYEDPESEYGGINVIDSVYAYSYEELLNKKLSGMALGPLIFLTTKDER